MRTCFVAALTICMLLNGRYASASGDVVFKLMNLLSESEINKNKQKTDEINELVSQLKNLNTATLGEIQLKSVETFVSNQQDQKKALKSLILATDAQTQNIQSLEKLYPGDRTIEALVARFNLNQQNISESITQYQATQKNQVEAVKTLVENNLAQVKNIKDGCSEIIKILLDAKGNSNAVEKAKRHAMVIAIKNEYVDIVKMLLKSGISLNTPNDKGITFLMVAAKNSTAILPLLIKAGADINAHDKEGYYVLNYAHKGGKKVEENVRLLRALGAQEKMYRAKSFKR